MEDETMKQNEQAILNEIETFEEAKAVTEEMKKMDYKNILNLMFNKEKREIYYTQKRLSEVVKQNNHLEIMINLKNKIEIEKSKADISIKKLNKDLICSNCHSKNIIEDKIICIHCKSERPYKKCKDCLTEW